MQRDTALALVRRSHAGDLSARDELVLGHQEMLRRLALRFLRTQRTACARAGLEVADLIQAGTVGLLEAIERCDPEIGFAALAGHHAWAGMQRAAESRRKWLPQAAVAYDTTEAEDVTSSWLDHRGPDPFTAGDLEALEAAMTALTPRQREVLGLLFGENLRPTDAARQLGLDRSTVEEHRDTAIARLRKILL